MTNLNKLKQASFIALIALFLGPLSSPAFGAPTKAIEESITAQDQMTKHDLPTVSMIAMDKTLNQETLQEAPTKREPQEVPIPAAVWLFGSALLGFIKMTTRRSI